MTAIITFQPTTKGSEVLIDIPLVCKAAGVSLIDFPLLIELNNLDTAMKNIQLQCDLAGEGRTLLTVRASYPMNDELWAIVESISEERSLLGYDLSGITAVAILLREDDLASLNGRTMLEKGRVLTSESDYPEVAQGNDHLLDGFFIKHKAVAFQLLDELGTLNSFIEEKEAIRKPSASRAVSEMSF